jgi:hypothetical protein
MYPTGSRADFIKRCWYRSSAVQCCRSQPLVDKVIPICYLDPHEARPTLPRFSQILISDRVRKRPTEGDLDFITPKSILGYESSEPYIAILLGLNASTKQKPQVTTVPKPFSLRFYVQGTTAQSFPFLEKRPDILYALTQILDLENTPSDRTCYASQLAARIKFADTTCDSHMLWDVEPEEYENYRMEEELSSVRIG